LHDPPDGQLLKKLLTFRADLWRFCVRPRWGGLSRVPKNRDKFRGLLAAGGLVLTAGAFGLMLSGQSAAQTSTTQPQTKLTYVPAQTAAQPTVYETRMVRHPDGTTSMMRVPVSSTATTAPRPIKIQSTQTVDPKLSAANTNATAKPVATASQSSSAAAKPATNVAVKPGAPILMRRPLAPAQVQWSNAIAQANRMKTLRPANSFVSRLPQATLDRTRLPVLLPHPGGLIDTAKAKMVTFGDAYALNLPQAKGLQVTMYGNRSFVPTDKGAISSRPVQKLAGIAEDIRISQMEDGWTATFTRYGVVYSVDVSCDDINSPDCKTDAFIRKAIAQFDDVTVGADAQAEANGRITADGKPAQANPFSGLLNVFNKKGG
jgi:hypothetical protein